MGRNLTRAWLLHVTENTGEDTSGGDTPPAENPSADPAGLNADGFPGGVAVADMPAEQQAAYWKHKARKHEDTAKARGDYDAVKAERDRLLQAGMTDAEKAVNTARAEGEAAGRLAAVTATVGDLLDVALSTRQGLTEDQITVIKRGFNPAAFIGDTGIDTAAVKACAATFGSAAGAGNSWPDTGGGGRGGGPNSGKPTTVADAMAQYRESKTKK